MRRAALLLMMLLLSTSPNLRGQGDDDGYRGIWYSNQPSGDAYGYKYSGGFATYPQQQLPIAVYSRRAHKTFFCYGGRSRDKNELLHMVSYYDHATGQVPRPTILLNKHTDDAHDNPTIMVDDAGHIWIFSAAHGTARPSWIHRSKRPGAVDAFEQIVETNFSYSQPWWLPGRGFLFLHTRYQGGRGLFWMNSLEGRQWDKPQKLAHIEMGDYQISWRHGDRLGTVFDYHPRPVGLNARANIYYVETRDFGKTWTTIDGRPLELPLTDSANPALVYDSRAENRMVYLKDLNFDRDGNPVILYLTSTGYESGPQHGARPWFTMHWTGREWRRRSFTTSDHNYDHGSLAIESNGDWTVIAPTEPGPQPWTTGGEMVMWRSHDAGANWTKVRELTANSQFNHTYARRPVDAHEDFFAIWADGNPLERSESRLYFTNRDGSAVRRLPVAMSGSLAAPERVDAGGATSPSTCGADSAVPTELAKTPAPITIGPDATLLKDGKPYRAVGVNYFDCFLRTLKDGSDTSYEAGFATLRDHGIPFARFGATGFWPADMKLYREDRAEYFRRLDGVVRSAEKHGVGLVPSLFWLYSCVPDLVGEPMDQWANPSSRTREWMANYIGEVVPRYRNSPAIWMWELGNEYSLSASLPNADQHRPQIVVQLGTPDHRSERDELDFDMVRKVFIAFATEVRKHDPRRLIGTGDSFPRPSAWHQEHEGKWTQDSPQQFREMLAKANPDPVSAISVHAYGDDNARFTDLLAVSRRLGKPLFLGEFGVPGETPEQVAKFDRMLAAIADNPIPLAAFWVFDYSRQAEFNVNAKNGRTYQLRAIADVNRRLREGKPD